MTTTETPPATMTTRRGSDPAAPLTIPMGVLGALARCATPADVYVRHAGMRGVQVDRVANVARATDSAIAMIVPLGMDIPTRAGAAPWVLSAADIVTAEKATPPTARYAVTATIVPTDGRHLTMTTAPHRNASPKLAARIATVGANISPGDSESFPSFDGILPEERMARFWVALDAEKLATLAIAMRDAGRAIIGPHNGSGAPDIEPPTVMLGFRDADRAIIVRPSKPKAAPGVHGVIMPVACEALPRVQWDDEVARAERERDEAQADAERARQALADVGPDARAARQERDVMERERNDARRERDEARRALDTIRRALAAIPPSAP